MRISFVLVKSIPVNTFFVNTAKGTIKSLTFVYEEGCLVALAGSV